MTTIAARTAPRVARLAALARSERLLAALPLATAYVWLCFLYATESWGHVAPWLFGDELEFTQLSRAVAETGEAARRGDPHNFVSFYTYLLAPVWWLDSTETAYTVAKYVGVLVMTSAMFPAYALARLLVSRPAALFAAVGTASIPALYYSSFLFEEPLAYPYSALCLFLIVKALATLRPGWLAGATVAAVAAPFVRDQLVVIPAALALASLAMLWMSGRAKRMRAGWTSWDWVGWATLVVGAVVIGNAFISHRSYPWLISTIFYKDRMIENGLWAAGAFTIGIGVFPVVAGLAALIRPRAEHPSPEMRAFVAAGAAYVLGFGWYTAVKAAFISTVFSTLTVERNLIYVAPVLFVATAIFFQRPRVRIWALSGAAALALYVLVTTPYQMQFRLYADAPGFAILQAANTNLSWTPERAEQVLVGMLVVSVFLCLLPLVADVLGRAVLVGIFALAAAGVVAWNVTGQIAAATGANIQSDSSITGIERPLDWIDRATGRTRAVYIGQAITDPNGIWQLEFWNRSIVNVWSTDGTAPGPGPTLTPDLLDRDGTITQPRLPGIRYAVVERGVDIVGDLVKKQERRAGTGTTEWLLYKIDPPLRLRSAVLGIYPDGWATGDTRYSLFSSKRVSGRGYALVTVSRKSWGGADKPGNVTVSIGPLELDQQRQPRLGAVTHRCTWVVHRLQERTFVLPAPPPPFHVRVTVNPTFSPNELDPRISDVRQLGAFISFGHSQQPPSGYRVC